MIELYKHLKCPDGTLLVSIKRHDYVTHIDKTNGKFYMLDGGINNGYNRMSVNGDEEIFTVTSLDDIKVIREYFKWGRNFDENMNKLPQTEWIFLKDINNDHLDKIIDYLIDKKKDEMFIIFLKEKQYRNLK